MRPPGLPGHAPREHAPRLPGGDPAGGADDRVRHPVNDRQRTGADARRNRRPHHRRSTEALGN